MNLPAGDLTTQQRKQRRNRLFEENRLYKADFDRQISRDNFTGNRRETSTNKQIDRNHSTLISTLTRCQQKVSIAESVKCLWSKDLIKKYKGVIELERLGQKLLESQHFRSVMEAGIIPALIKMLSIPRHPFLQAKALKIMTGISNWVSKYQFGVVFNMTSLPISIALNCLSSKDDSVVENVMLMMTHLIKRGYKCKQEQMVSFFELMTAIMKRWQSDRHKLRTLTEFACYYHINLTGGTLQNGSILFTITNKLIETEQGSPTQSNIIMIVLSWVKCLMSKICDSLNSPLEVLSTKYPAMMELITTMVSFNLESYCLNVFAWKRTMISFISNQIGRRIAIRLGIMQKIEHYLAKPELKSSIGIVLVEIFHYLIRYTPKQSVAALLKQEVVFAKMRILYKWASKKELESLNKTVNTMLQFTSKNFNFIGIILKHQLLESFLERARSGGVEDSLQELKRSLQKLKTRPKLREEYKSVIRLVAGQKNMTTIVEILNKEDQKGNKTKTIRKYYESLRRQSQQELDQLQLPFAVEGSQTSIDAESDAMSDIESDQE